MGKCELTQTLLKIGLDMALKSATMGLDLWSPDLLDLASQLKFWSENDESLRRDFLSVIGELGAIDPLTKAFEHDKMVEYMRENGKIARMIAEQNRLIGDRKKKFGKSDVLEANSRMRSNLGVIYSEDKRSDVSSELYMSSEYITLESEPVLLKFSKNSKLTLRLS